MSEKEIELFNELILKSKEGPHLLFEQYKLYVELMDKVSERRHNVNTFFLSINSILITVLTIFLTQVDLVKSNKWLILIALAAGIVFCISWRQLIKSYVQLNKGKFIIIHSLEKKLPANLFDLEWDILINEENYRPFTITEMIIPLIFIVLYGAIIIITILA